MKQSVLYGYERHTHHVFLHTANEESIETGCLQRRPGLEWVGLSRGGDRSRQHTVPIDAYGMRFGLRCWHEAGLKKVGGEKVFGGGGGGVPILFDRCITVWVSLTVLAYMLPMSISHAGTGRCWRWRTMWRSLGWNAPAKIHSHQQLLITEPWSLNHSPLS